MVNFQRVIPAAAALAVIGVGIIAWWSRGPRDTAEMLSSGNPGEQSRAVANLLDNVRRIRERRSSQP